MAKQRKLDVRSHLKIESMEIADRERGTKQIQP